jgi:4-amino-4-deoxy-L-arabinose transferase-like glycosyltransferase
VRESNDADEFPSAINPDANWKSRMRLPSARLIDAGAYGIIAVWTAIALYISIANPAIQESDMFGFIERAEKLSRENWSAWVDGFYPLGYPLLLRILFHFTGDYVVAGKALSLVSGVGGLFAIYGIARIAFSTPVALLALGFCCLNRVYLGYSVTPSTDMPATGLLLLGIYGICLFSSRHALKYLFWSGAAFGLSYLMRYTTITVIPVVFVWLLFSPELPNFRSRHLRSQVFSSYVLLFLRYHNWWRLSSSKVTHSTTDRLRTFTLACSGAQIGASTFTTAVIRTSH